MNMLHVAAGDGATERIGFDYYHMGQELGAQIRKEQQGKRLYILGRQDPDPVSIRFQDGILNVLEPEGYQVLFRNGRGGEDLKAAVRKILQEEKQAVIAALDPVSLTEAAQQLSEMEPDFEVGGLYGRGTTVRLLNYLDKGVIQGLCITDDFSAGYLSVRMAVDMVENRFVEDHDYLKSQCISRKDLHDEEYEKMLYPIE